MEFVIFCRSLSYLTISTNVSANISGFTVLRLKDNEVMMIACLGLVPEDFTAILPPTEEYIGVEILSLWKRNLCAIIVLS